MKLLDRLIYWIDRVWTGIETAAFTVDEDLSSAQLRRQVARDNKRAIRSNLYRFAAPDADRLRPRGDEVVLR